MPLKPLSTAERIVDYLEEAPKKCFFSVYNEFIKHESTLIAIRHTELINKIVELWDKRPNQAETFKEFKERIKNMGL
jgi:hypothetical protein